MDSLRSRKCLVCGISPTDPAHVKTRGSGGNDDEWNVMPLCRMCHIEQHKIGIVTFARKHWGVFEWLLQNGWELHNGKLWNDRTLGLKKDKDKNE